MESKKMVDSVIPDEDESSTKEQELASVQSPFLQATRRSGMTPLALAFSILAIVVSVIGIERARRVTALADKVAEPETQLATNADATSVADSMEELEARVVVLETVLAAKVATHEATMPAPPTMDEKSEAHVDYYGNDEEEQPAVTPSLTVTPPSSAVPPASDYYGPQ